MKTLSDFLQHFDISAASSVVSAIIALMALLYSYSQSNIKKYEVKRDYRTTILAWFADTTKLLIELRMLLEHAPQAHKVEKTKLLASLSSQIEVGRLYFPNINKGDGYGDEKPKAFRGYRNLTLDFLVYSFNIFSRDDAKSYINHLTRLQREFTSIICETVDQEDFLKELKKHSDRFFSHTLIYDDFLKNNPTNVDLLIPAQHKRPR